MSRKWARSKQWDDQHFPAWAWPVKAVLRAFSSIWLAVILLTFVGMYGALASVPVGIFALAPTYVFYGLTIAAAVGLVSVLPVWTADRVARGQGVSKGARFFVGLPLAVGLGVAAIALWNVTLWPHLRYDPVSGEGVRLFAGFADRWASVTLRRLPAFEMTELQFYGWWPFRLALVLFIVNMIVATARRIDFVFANVGVLTVHTGIIVIAFGSMYYTRAKQEGDMLLLAGPPDELTGQITPGPSQNTFYDGQRVAIYVADRIGRMVAYDAGRIPRYNDYNLDALGTGEPFPGAFASDEGRTLDRPLDPPPSASDMGFDLRVIGYASYAEFDPQWIETDTPPAGVPTGVSRAFRIGGAPPDPTTGEPGPTIVLPDFTLMPDLPRRRVQREVEGQSGVVAVEYTRGMDDGRWSALTAQTPTASSYALVVRVPELGYEETFAVREGSVLALGDTGYRLSVESVSPEPPFPIITPGYRGATSSVAVVRVTPPEPSGEPAFERWVYHRFPEIGQDMVDAASAEGQPQRRPADASIDIQLIDASQLQVYLDERNDGTWRAAIRPRSSVSATVLEFDGPSRLDLGPALWIDIDPDVRRLAEVRIPSVTPEDDRDNSMIGTHASAGVALEITAPGRVDEAPFRRVMWLPFARYRGLAPDTDRVLTLPSGQQLTLTFGRASIPLPGIEVQLLDFEMTPYPHSMTPRDFRSDLAIIRDVGGGMMRREEAHTSLNDPLTVRARFQPVESVDPEFLKPLVNAVGRTFSYVAPNQYKFSQASWDQQGWMETVQMASEGLVPAPRARYTILGVGNNPGIYIIAAGSIIVCVGIPWAFYVKPWLTRRKRDRLRRQLATAGGEGGS